MQLHRLYDQHHHRDVDKKVPLTKQTQNMLLPNHAPELVNYLLPPYLKQACTVRGLENTCSLQHCLHKAIWLARPADDVAEVLHGNLPILSFFVNQHMLQLPPSPFFAFPRPKEPSPTPAGFTAGGTSDAQLLLVPAVLLLDNTQDDSWHSSPGREPKRWGRNIHALWQRCRS